jgi:hypothetical protein
MRDTVYSASIAIKICRRMSNDESLRVLCRISVVPPEATVRQMGAADCGRCPLMHGTAARVMSTVPLFTTVAVTRAGQSHCGARLSPISVTMLTARAPLISLSAPLSPGCAGAGGGGLPAVMRRALGQRACPSRATAISPSRRGPLAQDRAFRNRNLSDSTGSNAVSAAASRLLAAVAVRLGRRANLPP